MVAGRNIWTDITFARHTRGLMSNSDTKLKCTDIFHAWSDTERLSATQFANVQDNDVLSPQFATVQDNDVLSPSVCHCAGQ